jgi:hypothetical protein
MSTQGGEAVRSGQILKQNIETVFAARGFVIRNYTDVRESHDLLAGKVLVRRPAYRTLFGRQGRGDFLALFGGRRVWIESVWQEVSGSADFKFAYILKSIEKDIIPAKEILIVHGGDGGDGKGIAWMADESHLVIGKRIWVLHFDDFPRWVRDQMQPRQTEQEMML